MEGEVFQAHVPPPPPFGGGTKENKYACVVAPLFWSGKIVYMGSTPKMIRITGVARLAPKKGGEGHFGDALCLTTTPPFVFGDSS